MDFDDIIFWGLLIIGILAAIAFWPLTLAIIVIYFVRKNKKKQEYNYREYQIQDIQNTVSEIKNDIEIAANQKADLCRKITNAHEELTRLRGCLADTLRFQSFIAAVGQRSDLYVVPKTIDRFNAQIAAQEELIKELEAEDKSLAAKAEKLKNTLEAKTQEISSLQIIQAAQKNKKR